MRTSDGLNGRILAELFGASRAERATLGAVGLSTSSFPGAGVLYSRHQVHTAHHG